MGRKLSMAVGSAFQNLKKNPSFNREKGKEINKREETWNSV